MKICALLLMCAVTLSLSGCLAAAIGAGAAGGVYVDKNYDFSVHKKHHKAEQKKSSKKESTSSTQETY